MSEQAPKISIKFLENAMAKALDDFESLNMSEVSAERVIEKPRETLEDFVSRPFTTSEIRSKEDYVKHVITWFSTALKNANYQDVDNLIKNSLDKISFNQPPENFVDDINRIINNIYKDGPAKSIQAIEPVVNTEPVAVSTEKAVQTTVTDLPIEASPAVVLTPEQRVNVPATTIEEKIIPVAESVEATETKNEYRTKLENLNSQPFNREAYLEYTFDVHAGLRARYDAVLTNARNNLKRFSTNYTPSKTEKEALQFLSSLQGQHAKMQAAESETGVVRAELTNSLNRTDAFTSEAEVKNSAEKYLSEVEKLLGNITKLEGLIEVAKSEEKPPLAEAYRAQLEKIRVEGNQVLTTVDVNHPLYDQFKSAVTDDLARLISFASIEKDGDRAVIEGSDTFLLRRDRIKAAILYMKTDHEFSDFYRRAQKRVNEMSLLIEKSNPVTSEAIHARDSLQGNLNDLKVLLEKKNVIDENRDWDFVTTDLFTEQAEALKKQKQDIQNLLGGAQVLLSELGTPEQAPTEVVVPEPAPVVWESLTQSDGIVKSIEARRKLIQEQSPKSETARAIVSAFLARIQPSNVGKIAAMAAILATAPNMTSTVASAQSNGFNKMPILNEQNISNVGSQFNFDGVLNFLRYKNQPESILKPITPTITQFATMETIPFAQTEVKTVLQPQPPAEVVPGIAFAASYDHVTMPTAPDLKIFSAQADQVPADDGIIFSDASEEAPDNLYKINFGDRFWDINEGETLAGKLPVMSQINPYFKQALIDRMRDKINSDAAVREKIGGIGESADQLQTDEYMNLTELNNLAEIIAVEYGYLS